VWRDYSTLTIDRGPYVLNVQRAAEFEFRRLLSKIGKPVDREDWRMTPPEVNAYYDAQLNEIVFPAGILQPPFFDPKADDAVNYGAMGAVIGHELTHGFDDEGRKFDARGNMSDWWTAEDANNYEARAKCVESQFAAYTYEGQNVNGKLVLGESIRTSEESRSRTAPTGARSRASLSPRRSTGCRAISASTSRGRGSGRPTSGRSSRSS
jgi:putative endopeptidase